MPLHPQVKTALEQMAAAGPPLHHLSPVECRNVMEATPTKMYKTVYAV